MKVTKEWLKKVCNKDKESIIWFNNYKGRSINDVLLTMLEENKIEWLNEIIIRHALSFVKEREKLLLTYCIGAVKKVKAKFVNGFPDGQLFDNIIDLLENYSKFTITSYKLSDKNNWDQTQKYFDRIDSQIKLLEKNLYHTVIYSDWDKIDQTSRIVCMALINLLKIPGSEEDEQFYCAKQCTLQVFCVTDGLGLIKEILFEGIKLMKKSH